MRAVGVWATKCFGVCVLLHARRWENGFDWLSHVTDILHVTYSYVWLRHVPSFWSYMILFC